MAFYLHKSLCDLSKAGQLASSANPNSTAGEQRGGSYFHRIQTGYKKDNTPDYRYFRTKEEWDSYQKKNSKVEENKKDDKKPGKDLEEKTKQEHEASTKKVKDQGLFIKDKDKPIKKSLYIRLEAKR